MFPANGSLAAAPPFPPSGPGEPSSPLSAVLRRRYDFPCAYQWSLICFASTAHGYPLASCSPQRSCECRRSVPGQGSWSAGAPILRLTLTWTRMGSLRSSGDPSRAFAPFQDPGRAELPSPVADTSMLPPLPIQRRPRRYPDFGANPQLQHSLPYASGGRCRTPARLTSGRRAAPLPGGIRTLWTATKGFSSFDDHPPFLLS